MSYFSFEIILIPVKKHNSYHHSHAHFELSE